jgi:hypothetical protein
VLTSDRFWPKAVLRNRQKSPQQSCPISTTQNLIDYGAFQRSQDQSEIHIVECRLRLIVNCIAHMDGNTYAHWRMHIAAQIISKQPPDLIECELE